MSIKIVGGVGLLGGVMSGVMYAEKYLIANVDMLSQLTQKSELGVSKLYGVVILGNLVASSVVMLYLGAKVGMARSKAIEKAKKDGDEHAEARFSYPKLYAEGFDENSKVFNCVQRGHQNGLESYPQYLALSAVAGLTYPITTSLFGLFWTVGRLSYAQGYATGNPRERYTGAALTMISWFGLTFVSGATALKVLGIL